MYHLKAIFVIDNGYQTGAGGQNSFLLILPPLIRVQLRCPFTVQGGRPEVDSENFRQLRDMKRTNSNGKEL